MKPLAVLINTYKELLKIEDISIRLQLQPIYCQLRDTIASELCKSPQVVQEEYEILALAEKRVTH